MSAAPDLVEVDDDDEPAASSFDARRLAQWIIVAGLVLGAAAAGFLIWEAWSANRDALEYNRAADGARVFPFADGSNSAAPPDPGPPPGPGPEESYDETS